MAREYCKKCVYKGGVWWIFADSLPKRRPHTRYTKTDAENTASAGGGSWRHYMQHMCKVGMGHLTSPNNNSLFAYSSLTVTGTRRWPAALSSRSKLLTVTGRRFMSSPRAFCIGWSTSMWKRKLSFREALSLSNQQDRTREKRKESKETGQQQSHISSS